MRITCCLVYFISLLLLLGCFGNDVFSQNLDIDSLKSVLTKYGEDTARVNTLNLLSVELTSKKPDLAMEYAIEALGLSKRLKYEKGIGNSFHNIGNSFRYQNSFKEALDNYTAALKIRKKINDKEDLAANYDALGNLYFLEGDYPNSIDNFLTSLKLSEELGDKRRGSRTCNNIGSVYMSQSNYSEALIYHFKSLKLKEELELENPGDPSNKKSIAASYNNIGSVHMYQKNYEEALKYYFNAVKIGLEIADKKRLAESYNNIGFIYTKLHNYIKALDYNTNALEIKKELGDKKGMANSYTNIGSIYEEEKKYAEALNYYEQALKLNNETNDKNGVATSSYNIGSALKNLGKYKESIDYLYKSKKIAKEIGAKRIVQESFEGLSDAYAEIKNFEKAYEYHTQFSKLKDSIFNETKANQITELSTKYESEKKEKEIELLTKQNELHEVRSDRDKILIYSFSGGFALFLILAVVSLNAYRQKRKANDQLENQNKEISNQKYIIEAKNKDITDSIVYAKRIQEAILPHDSVLNNAFEDYFILFKPKDIVSGDFYWFNELNLSNGCELKYLAAVDCTGHGVPGAFMSIIGHTSLNQAIIEHGKINPSEILEETNKILSDTLRQNKQESDVKDGMDIALCCFDFKNNLVQFSGAYNPLWIIKKGSEEIIEIKADKHPIGSFWDDAPKSFTNHVISLEKGDTVYFFSDGFSDQFGGPNGKKYKPKQFKEVLLSVQSKPLKEQKKVLESSMENWKGALEQIDDILVMGVRI